VTVTSKADVLAEVPDIKKIRGFKPPVFLFAPKVGRRDCRIERLSALSDESQQYPHRGFASVAYHPIVMVSNLFPSDKHSGKILQQSIPRLPREDIWTYLFRFG